MNEKPITDASLRQFLLGTVNEQERQRIESMFVTGALSNERVIAAEQQLIDDYLEDSLTPADKERFLAQYGNTPVQRRRLRIAKSIQEWAANAADVSPPSPGAVSTWSRLRENLRLKPAFVIPIAALSIVVIIVAIVWLNSELKQRNRHLALEQELSRINAPSTLTETPSQITLLPWSARSVETENQLTAPANAEFVALTLLWTQKERYPSYKATIRKFADDEWFTIPNLQPDNGGNSIRLKLPTSLLSRGLYQLYVSGVAPDGNTALTEEYKFQVRE